ncbi:MAG: hypothetical protein WCK65_14905 [Rhodospirillaceae bacterium]
MAIHRPVVLIGGKLCQLPTGDTLSAKIQEVDVVELQAKAILDAGMAVYNNGGFQVMKADAATDAKANVLGLAWTSAIVDAYVNVQTDGVLELADWGPATGGTDTFLVSGAQYFLGVEGLITNTPPTTGNSVYIGRSISPQKMEISIERPIGL